VSYILDALKKAEQERKRGETPDIMAEHEDRADKPKIKVWLYALLVLLAAAAGSAGWYLGSDKLSSVSVKPQQTAQVATNPPVQPQPATPPSATPASEIPTPVPQVKTAETKAAAKESAARADKREATGKPDLLTSRADKAARITKAVSSTDRSHPSQSTSEILEPAVAKKPVPGNRIYSISELPDEIRQGLPALSISTHIYAPEKSERLAAINGHIGREGQEILPGIALESITSAGVVLRYQGYKFIVALR
jgi:general secretion pathway protein B